MFVEMRSMFYFFFILCEIFSYLIAEISGNDSSLYISDYKFIIGYFLTFL